MLTATQVNVITLGVDTIDLNTIGLTDAQLLTAAGKMFPKGINVHGSNAGTVWVHPVMLLRLAQVDNFGIEMKGIAHTGAELLRLAADPEKVEALGNKGCDRMVKLFAAQAKTQADSKRPNQLYAVRWGAAAKVAGADRVEPNTIEVHPDGAPARRLAETFGCVPGAAGGWADLDGRHVLILRHPFIMSYVARIVFNDQLCSVDESTGAAHPSNLVLVNRLDFRRATLGDFDGDSAAFFPIHTQAQAEAIAAQIEAIVPNSDSSALIMSKAAHDPEAEMWGEVLTKSTDDKLAQSFTKSTRDWIKSHRLMGDYANRLTPFAYRISDICGLMAAMGFKGARVASLMGATIEETYYLGLTGGPKALDEALEIWFRFKMSGANQRLMFQGLREGVGADVLTDVDVREAIVKGSLINRGKFDPNHAREMLVHMGHQVAKGRLTTMPNAAAKLELLAAIAGDLNTPEDVRDNVVAKMLFHAARKLAQVVDKNQLNLEDEDEAMPETDDADYSTSFEE